jgi:hypothetical protein
LIGPFISSVSVTVPGNLAEKRRRISGQFSILSSTKTASRYRKQFVASRESSTVVDNESSIMKAESTDESSATDERRAVGEEEASPLPFSRM